MKPHYHKVPKKLENSFSLRKDISANFESTWHYHPELELHYTKKGEGLRFIGDNISNFNSDEMLLLGENLPHTWKSHDAYLNPQSKLEVEAMVMHFLPDCLGQEFLSLPEAYQLNQLIKKAKNGLLIHGDTKRKLLNLLEATYQAENLDRISLFISILSTLAETKEYEPITNSHAFYQSNQLETDRLNQIYTYTLKNYMNKISLAQIASLSCLSITSFCRYFKMMTNKTYTDFLSEIRISYACKFLIENKQLTIESISSETGFNNASNFFRQFKKTIGLTPKAYRKKYRSS
jgi:AraC-like DNA-binding protein